MSDQLLIRRGDRTVPITVFARTSATPGTAFRVIVPIDLSAVFRPWGPFPGIAGVEGQTAAWDRAGVSRRPRFTDGSEAVETLTEYTDGHGFAYQLTGFTNVLARLASGVRGEWSFLPDGTGTMIRWTYEFKPLPGRRWIIAGPFTPLWARYMQAALDRMITVVEEVPDR
ncbi:SRPBCC family protein [Catenuloplanes sp. NPDC051500]|uniref:SRPBCC family protein n=1 Tax=Catenuloplanes sp. NPDC051500 TaxID=3363959 RepID=UPI00379DF949